MASHIEPSCAATLAPEKSARLVPLAKGESASSMIPWSLGPVVVGEADGLLALLGDTHAVDDAVDLACVERGNQAVPVDLDEGHVPAVGIADHLGDLGVIAAHVAASVRERDGAVRVVCLNPAVWRVVAVGTDAQRCPLAPGVSTVGGCAAVRSSAAADKSHRRDREQPTPATLMKFLLESVLMVSSLDRYISQWSGVRAWKNTPAVVCSNNKT